MTGDLKANGNRPAESGLFLLLRDKEIALYLTPKVASSSIIQSLSTYYGLWVDDHIRLKHFEHVDRETVETSLRSWRCAMFVRNPFDRLAANYNYFIRMGRLRNTVMKHQGFRIGMSFDEFLTSVVKDTEANHHYSLQSKQMPREDFVGKFESLDKDWDAFRTFCGCDFPDLERINSGGKRPEYRSLYSNWWREAISITYEPDLEKYNYSF